MDARLIPAPVPFWWAWPNLIAVDEDDKRECRILQRRVRLSPSTTYLATINHLPINKRGERCSPWRSQRLGIKFLQPFRRRNSRTSDAISKVFTSKKAKL